MDAKKKTKIGLIIVSILLAALAIISGTNAYYNRDTYAKNPHEYQTGTLVIEAKSKTSNISLTNALPISDAEGINTEPYVFTIKNIGNVDYSFNVKLLSTNANAINSQYIKLKIDNGGVTTLSNLTNSIIKGGVVLKAGETIDISLRAWLSSNMPNTQLGKSFNSKIVIDGQAVYTESNNEFNATPIEDFQYYLGPEYDNINYYSDEYGIDIDIDIAPIALAENEVLLIRYNGSNPNVVIPDNYTIDGITYNVVLLSSVYINYYDSSIGIEIDDATGVFQYNNIIESVSLGKNVKLNAYGNDNAANLLFYYCENLVSVPVIPSSVTNMNSTFYGCTSLVNAPVIPSSVTNMENTFFNCTSLVNAPVIPSSVTNMENTFCGCTSLINAPVIPSSVTNMYGTFDGCIKLTGTVRINSSNVSNCNFTFYYTSKNITLQVPSGSTTYNSFNASTLPSNVTLTTF